MNKNTVGVIVGRFQVPELTNGHKEIFDYVLNKGYEQNIVVLGVAPTKATKMNPLDFDSRRKMINETYPNMFTIMYLKDEPSDEEWSKKLDKMILDIANDKNVILYGNKESFINRYIGSLKTEEYIQKIICSEAEERFYTGKKVQNNAEWRAGVMWATQNRYDTVYPTVDCAIFDDDQFKYMYMAKKENESLLRFVGGFADPHLDNSYEDSAIREAKEETGLNCEIISWIGSSKIDDPRYRFESDKIITNLFALKKLSGIAKADDDIKELHRVEVNSLTEDQIIKEHRVLFKKVKKWVEKENSNLKNCNMMD